LDWNSLENAVKYKNKPDPISIRKAAGAPYKIPSTD
jgi:hypothetical protein